MLLTHRTHTEEEGDRTFEWLLRTFDAFLEWPKVRLWVFGDLHEAPRVLREAGTLWSSLAFEIIDSVESSVEKHSHASLHVSMHSFTHSFIQ